MRHTLRSTLAVLLVTALTALAIFATVQYGIGGDITYGAAVAGSGATQTCPATGCKASSCHATQGGTPSAEDAGGLHGGRGSDQGFPGSI